MLVIEKNNVKFSKIKNHSCCTSTIFPDAEISTSTISIKTSGYFGILRRQYGTVWDGLNGLIATLDLLAVAVDA